MPSAYDFPQTHGVDFSYLADATDLVHNPWTNSGVHSRPVANNMTTVPRNNGHHRDQSTSSIGSASTHPLYNNRAQTVTSRKSQTQRSTHTSNQLPTPTQTPTKPSFLSSTPSNLSQPAQNLDHSIATSMALSQALYQSHDNMSQMHSGRPNFSSGQEPMTPRTAYSDYQENHGAQAGETQNPDVDAWLAEYLRSGNDLDTMTHPMVPKFERTLTDAYQDELYLPQQQMQPSQQLSSTSYLMPQNQMVQDRLNEARMARTASSSTNQSGPLSPFKATSPFMHSPAPYSQQVHPMRRDDRVSPQSESEPKTISPQEAMLDYKPQRDEVPLFGQTSANYGSYTAVAPNTSKPSAFQTVPSMAFGGMPSANHGAWSNDLQQATLTSAPLQNFNFEAPALPANLSGLSNHYLASASVSSRAASRQTDRTPEFPAHLPTMESSASEAPPSSGQSSHAQMMDSPKPPSNADTGTYSCTYHGCSQRFATPRELQRHKRDIHRANPHVTPGVGSGMSSAQLMERNSQSGPHRCERINPTTGKPCNTNFSRPYDLTRHEDTIHNIRKLKLKCALCTEEKLFSRNDALTRHLRVVHPEVEFPGKHRRRGTRGD
jgi:hypothetical protein